MSHPIAALNSPGILLPSAQTRLAKAMAASSSSTTGSAATTDIGSTFLNLLSTELQNQDPTAPVDSTAMVGQMISLNQLDQLISINQTLGATPTSTTHSTSSALQSIASVASASPAGASSLDPNSLLASPTTPLPFDPATMMPIVNPSFSQTTSVGGK